MPDFEELERPIKNAREIPRRIELLRKALEEARGRASSALLSWLHDELATCLLDNPEGSRADNLEQAIAHCEQALDGVRCQDRPESWATIQNHLAIACSRRLLGNPSENLERAIACMESALKVLTREHNPVTWAAISNNLGRIYIDRVAGDRAENLEHAIQLLEQALQVRTRDASAEDWAMTHVNLGRAHQRQGATSKAIAHYTEALTVLTLAAAPEEWAEIQQKVGLCRAVMESPGEAIAHLESALQIHTRENHPNEWATDHWALGRLYTEVEGDRTSNLERAIEHYEQALSGFEKKPRIQAQIHVELAFAYKLRRSGEHGANLERAKRHTLAALSLTTREACPEDWARDQNLLGEIFEESTLGDPTSNVARAIEHYQLALEVYTRDGHPQEWAICQIDLGNVYMHPEMADPADALERAIVHYENALEVFTRATHADQFARTQHNLGGAYSLRIRGDRATNLEQAIAHYHAALEIRTRERAPEQWATTQSDLANAYSQRIRGQREHNVKEAIARCRLALEVFKLEQLPAECGEAQRRLGDILFGEQAWAESLVAFREAIRAEHALLASAYTERGRRLEMGRTWRVHAHAAYALAKLGQPGDALAQLEQGKTRELSRALVLDGLDVSALSAQDRESLLGARAEIRALTAAHRPLDEAGAEEIVVSFGPGERSVTSHRYVQRLESLALERARFHLNETIERIRRASPQFMPEGLEVREILGLIPDGAALVAPVITSQGGAALVVPGGSQSVTPAHILWLNDFGEADLRNLLWGPDQRSGWFGGYLRARTDPQAWRNTIESVGEALWGRLMGPIAERLDSLHAKHVLVMPQGGLGILPLHAAWRIVDRKRHYFLDDHVVSYVASARAQRVSSERLRDVHRQVRTLHAVVNPTKDLEYAEAEGGLVAAVFEKDNARLLSGDNATPQAVLDGQGSYLHFACHGFYDWRDPMRSGIVLAHGETLTVQQVISRLDLNANRLVTLSACETGMTDILQVPDECLGMPAGFLAAGAPAVVSTLWAVKDISTMLLMEQFYRLHLDDLLAPPAALRKAQLWLRDVTADQLATRFRGYLESALVGQGRVPAELALQAYSHFAALTPTHQPFDHPFFWGPFTLSGA